MTRAPLSGRKLGNYDVGPLVGSGGMGEVYRGRDTSLNRDVAIKVLLPAVAADQERLARFNREAQVLASLNHPHIAQIHGVEQSDAGPLLVLEYVAGPTLADRVAEGPIPIDEALTIARQIADALEAAHERGVIHRDLKPANIKVSEDGAVKVLDFGLAKAVDQGSGIGDQGSGERANSPTITTPAMTQAGLILGTAAYMSPEQAKGRVVDKRSDVWAFGCVLYEMLTGTRAFGGEDVTDTIAAVVRGEPDWSALPPDVPPQIRLLLKRCLEKDRRARISDIGVARFLMNEPTATTGQVPAPPIAAPASRFRFGIAAAAGLLVGALLAAWGLSSRTSSSPVRAVSFTITPPANQRLLPQVNDHNVVFAPDGSFVIYRGGEGSALQSNLMFRAVNELEPRLLPGTTNARHPFISPDGRWVGFFVGPELHKVAVGGGAAVLICQISGSAPRGASWGDDGFIVLASAESPGLLRVPASGGEPKPFTNTDRAQREVHAYPHVLPGSKTVLFTSYSGNDFLTAKIEAIDVATGARKTVIQSGNDPSYASGYLMYATANESTDGQSRFRASLQVVRFDVSRMETLGEPVTAFDGVSMGTTAAANYGLSRRGDVVFIPAGINLEATRPRSLVWVDRKGKETPVGAKAQGYAVARISPDGSRVALDIRDQTNDIWVWDISRQTLTPLNRHPGQDMSPVWTPDSKRIVWTSTRAGGNPNLFWQPADGTGTPERLTNNPGNQFPTSITPDGATIALFGSSGNSTNAMDVFTVGINESERATKALLAAAGLDFDPEISPDGKWVAYHSNESGEFQVYVRPFPDVDAGKRQISTSGGTRAAWSRNGRELFYLDKDGFLTSVPVLPPAGPVFAAGSPAKILNSKYYLGSSLLGLDLRSYDVSTDGQRFLMIKELDDPRGPAQLAHMVIVLNWVEEMKARTPAQ